ncbi:unnamed protein product [Notodromas monacha]|uniref:non-specific serine/threonine protein kinase n=1 Tax=Notodromas monacha TaxID=399045 RepID=A0A7R9BH25_9CRUS|nr:unnamed protein product [Notodromas monacha]CAG0915346.1 unnamed protein product [Notodromas monacha]
MDWKNRFWRSADHDRRRYEMNVCFDSTAYPSSSSGHLNDSLPDLPHIVGLDELSRRLLASADDDEEEEEEEDDVDVNNKRGVVFDLSSPAASDKSSLSLSLSGHENESSFGDVLFPTSVLDDDDDVVGSPLTDDGESEPYLSPRFEWGYGCEGKEMRVARAKDRRASEELVDEGMGKFWPPPGVCDEAPVRYSPFVAPPSCAAAGVGSGLCGSAPSRFDGDFFGIGAEARPQQHERLRSSSAESEDSGDDESEERVLGSDEDEQEDPKDYDKGGYHPVKIGDLFHRRYHVVRKLGWGHFSTVWLCWDVETKRFVAMKVVKSAPHYTETALDEIKLLKCVRDSDPEDKFRERTVMLLDDFKINGIHGTHVCMVFEVLGCHLLKLIIRSRYCGIPIQNVKIIIREVLEGLHYLHTKCKIIHTDIKPENVLLAVSENYVRRLAFEATQYRRLGLKLPSSLVSTAPKELTTPRPENMTRKKRRQLRKKAQKDQEILEDRMRHLESQMHLELVEEPDEESSSLNTSHEPPMPSFNGSESRSAVREAMGKKLGVKKPISKDARLADDDFQKRIEQRKSFAEMEHAQVESILSRTDSEWRSAIDSPSGITNGLSLMDLDDANRNCVSLEPEALAKTLANGKEGWNNGCDMITDGTGVRHADFCVGDTEDDIVIYRRRAASYPGSDAMCSNESYPEVPLPPPPPPQASKIPRKVVTHQQSEITRSCTEPHASGAGASTEGIAKHGRGRVRLKPKNEPNPAFDPMTEKDLQVKIADLGNACWTFFQFTEDIQTRQYRCLEVLLGAGYGTPADIWSTACVAFELATGDYLFEPHSGEYYTRDDDHLGHIIELLGNIPMHIAFSGKYSDVFFTRKGTLKRISRLKPWGLVEVLTEKYEWPTKEAQDFADFLLPMLAFDPKERATAEQCLRQPWLRVDGASSGPGGDVSVETSPSSSSGYASVKTQASKG